MTFQPYDSHFDVEKTRRNLPHWHQPGTTYFVTFRLGDSLPAEALARLEQVKRMNNGVAFAWMERFLDAGVGACILAEPVNASLVANALRHFDGSRYTLGSFSVMPNHVHALVQPSAGYSLEYVTHGWKSYTANRLQRAVGIRGRVWQEESFDRIVRDEWELRRFHAYILANGEVANLRPNQFIVGEGTAKWFA